jgi:inner membrane protein
VEPFTHAFTSLALARAGGKRLPRFGTAMIVASGLAPDLDYASYLGGAEAFMRFHRSALHSVAGSAVMACAIAGAFCVLDRKMPPKKTARATTFVPLAFPAAFAVCAIGAAGHMVLDLASGVGVQLLWPFRAHWSAWNLINDLDLWALLLLVVGLLLPLLFGLVNEEVGERKKGPGGSRAAIVTLALLAAYLGARADLHSRAIDMVLSREYHGRIALSAEAYPESSAPFAWRGVAVTDNTIEEVEVPLGPGEEMDPNRSVTRYKPEDSPVLDAGEKTAAARKFLVYANVPFASVQPLEAGHRVEVHDLRFADGDMEPANVFVRVDFNSSMQITHEGFYFASNPNP